MALYADIAVRADGRSARARGYGEPGNAGNGEWPQVARACSQIAESLAEKQRRRHRAERWRPDALRARAADVPVDARRNNRLVLVAFVELVFHARREIVEPALLFAFIRTKLPVGHAEPDTELWRDALAELHRGIGFHRRRLVATRSALASGNRRQRELIGNERIFDGRCGGKKALARRAVGRCRFANAAAGDGGNEQRERTRGAPEAFLLRHVASPQ